MEQFLKLYDVNDRLFVLCTGAGLINPVLYCVLGGQKKKQMSTW